MNIETLTLIVAGLVTLGVATNLNHRPTTTTEKIVTATNLQKDTNAGNKSNELKLKELSLNNRLVYIYGEINGDSAPFVVQQLLTLGASAEPIFVLINSPGGSVLSGATIISALQAAKGPVNTVCVELCASMAAMIHQYGTNRLVINRSILMFHPASGGGNGGEVDKQFAELNFFKRFIGKMEENAANRAKLTYKEYKFLSGTELWLDSEDALNSNFADKVVYVSGSDVNKLNPSGGPISVNKVKKTIGTTVKRLDVIWE